MQVTLQRFTTSDIDTLGLLFVNGKFIAFTIEDAYHIKKIPGKTRIPAGRYRLELRESPTFSPKYGHDMIYLCDVPDFEGIMIHPGNDSTDTRGCILVGDSCDWQPDNAMFSKIFNSKRAYQRVYPVISYAIKNHDPVWIDVVDNMPFRGSIDIDALNTIA